MEAARNKSRSILVFFGFIASLFQAFESSLSTPSSSLSRAKIEIVRRRWRDAEDAPA